MRRAFVLWAAFGAALVLLLHVALLRFDRLFVDAGDKPSEPLLQGFWYAEQAPEQSGGFTYQWSTTSSTVLLPALAMNGAWLVDLRAWQDETQEKDLHLRAGSTILSIPTLPGVRRYHTLIPRLAPVTLTARVNDDDPTRQIGLAVDSIGATRLATHMAVDWAVVLLAVLLTAFLGFLAAAAGLGRGDTLLVAAGAAILFFLAFDRYPLYTFRALLPLNALLVSVLIIGSVSYYLAVMRLRVLPGYVIAALALIVFIKLAGILYPGFVGLDTAHHIRGVQGAIRGDLYRVGEGQGQNFPYPPAVYLLMAPFVLLVPDPQWVDLQWLLAFASVFLDSSTILLLYVILKHPAVPPAVCRWAVLLYAIIPAGFILFYDGTIAQNVGQWLGLCYIAALVYCIVHAEDFSSFRALGLITLGFLASLGHFGVFLNLNLMFVLLVLVFPRFAYNYRSILSTWFAGAVLSAVVYYSAFLPLLQEQLGNVTRRTEDPSTLRLFLLGRFIWDLGIQDHYLGVYVLLAGITMATMLRRERTGVAGTLARIFGAMLLTSATLGLLFVMLLLNATRFIIFSHTAIVIFAAFLLSAADNYRVGRLGSRALVVYTLATSLALWASGVALHARIGWLQ